MLIASKAQAHITPKEAAFGDEGIAVVRGYHEVVAEQSEDPQDPQNLVIDSDLVVSREVESKTFRTIREAQIALEGLANTLAVSPEIQTNREVMEQKLAALIMDARIRQGERFSFRERLVTSMQLSPLWVPNERLTNLKHAINAALPEGMEYRREDKEAYEQTFVLKTAPEVEQAVRAGMDASKIALSQFFEPQAEAVEPEIKEFEGNWSGYVATEDGKIVLKVNTNPDYKYTFGECVTLAGHEYAGHVEQLVQLQQAIERGEANPLLGLTSVYTPDAALFETVGQLAGSRLVIDESVPITRVQMLIDRLKTSVYNNMSYLANIRHEDDAAVADYAAKLLPFEDKDALRSRAEERRVAHYAPYLMCYEYGMRAVDAVLEKSSDMQRAIVPKLYKPITKQQQDAILATYAS